MMVAIAQQIPFSPTQEMINLVKDAIAHLEEVKQNLIDVVSDKDLIWVFIGGGKFYSGQGLYALAEPWYEECVSSVREKLGEEHLDVASSYNNLALLYSSQGRYSKAEPLYVKGLEIAERVLEENHPNTVTIRENLEILRAR